MSGGSAAGAMPSAAERTSPLRVVPRPGPQPAREPAARPAGGTATGQARGSPRGYPEPGGYAEADRAPRTPDRTAAWHGSPETEPWSEPPRGPQCPGSPSPRRMPGRAVAASPSRTEPSPDPSLGRPSRTGPSASGSGRRRRPPSGRRTGRRDRVPQSVFAELLSLAAIPHSAYAVDEEVPGAMCLVKADGGFEVFSRTDDARLEVRFFEDEEAAYFYLFGVLAAEAVRSGRLRPAAGSTGTSTDRADPRSRGPGHGKRFEVLTGQEVTQIGTSSS